MRAFPRPDGPKRAVVKSQRLTHGEYYAILGSVAMVTKVFISRTIDDVFPSIEAIDPAFAERWSLG
jgi:hypothetical protein